MDGMSLLEKIIAYQIKNEASDTHISSGDHPCVRIKGEIVRIVDIPQLSMEDTHKIYEAIIDILSQRSKNLAEYNKGELDTKGHTGFSFTMQNKRFRGNISKHNGGYYIVFRSIESEPIDLSVLGFDERAYNGLHRCLNKDAGIFIVTGATGSGKTTTLAAMIKEVNKRHSKNIITLEDPIEYEHKPIKSHVVQKEKGHDFYEFDEALRSILREDPDIVLVGEIRDRVTLELALELAETGHLVFGTLHTQSVVNTIGRMISMSNEKTLTRDKLANALIGIITQKLFKSPDGQRRIAWELLVSENGVANMIREGKEHQINGIIDTVEHSNSFNKCLERLYKKGLISEEKAKSLSLDEEHLHLKRGAEDEDRNVQKEKSDGNKFTF